MLNFPRSVFIILFVVATLAGAFWGYKSGVNDRLSSSPSQLLKQ